ncbi:sigma-54-dependent transcriptional regulator [Longimicrobium terrae]|nr:sigma-54 dependent transcriptional regulator [Longimicrobium terrae]
MAERTVLLIGDDAEVRDGVRAACERAGVAFRAAATLADGLRVLSDSHHHATVLLASAVDEDGAMIRRIASAPAAGTLVLVARAPSLRLAIDAPRLGAAELLTIPLDVDRLAALFSPAPPAGDIVPIPRLHAGSGDELVGSSPALVAVFKTVGRVAGSDATVLVTGESGTGKELVARALHAASGRSAGPFIAVNCAAIPEDLLESELFGHERGAFTGAIARKVGRFERANGGTLFLDEIGDMSLVLQAKILRALQEREIERLGGEARIRLDVRVVAATHRNLPSLIASGDFREDLFYRLAVVALHLPALRERTGDVRALALHYAARFAAEHARELRGITDGAMRGLETHAWPGNVRELRNVLERAVLLSPGDVLQVDHLQLSPAAARDDGVVDGAEALHGYSPHMTMAQVEALHIGRVLRQVDRHFGRAAEILDMHRNTVSRKAIEYGVLPG